MELKNETILINFWKYEIKNVDLPTKIHIF